MILFKKAMPLSRHLDNMRQSGREIGFVPTMGALHNGHAALLEACKKTAGFTVCSIFVNPAQFNNAADFNLYPNTIEQDIELLIRTGCDVLFLPSKEEMYPADLETKQYDLGNIETFLEGVYRPGHFQGVCQAVDRLLDIVAPHQIFFGQKDYQQCMVVKKLLSLTARQTTVLNIIPTQREASGLAMSSRNLRLNEAQREKAAALYQMLTFLKAHIAHKSIPELKEEGIGFLKSRGFNVDYVEIRDAEALCPLEKAGSKKVVGLVAAAIGGVRLIDNMLLN